MNNTQLKKLNKITYIIRLVIDKFQLGFFKPHINAFIDDPVNHPLMLEVYNKIERVIKE